jgi:hypothetical protein
MAHSISFVDIAFYLTYLLYPSEELKHDQYPDGYDCPSSF